MSDDWKMSDNWLFAIDPGLRRSGWAMFDGDTLHDAGTVTSKTTNTLPARIIHMVRTMGRRFAVGLATGHVVVEWPQVYHGSGKTKGQDANDLLPLAAIVGGVMCWGYSTQLVKPSEWKGQIPKKLAGKNPVRERILKRLSDYEKEIAGDLPHDGWDAIGIGLWALGRFEHRTFPGAT